MASTVNGPRLAYAHEKITTLTSATSLTASTYNVARSAQSGGYDSFDRTKRPLEAHITVETADIRWTADGTTPTVTAGTALGHIASAGDIITLIGYNNIANFKAINAVASSGSAIRVTYFA